MIILDSKLSFTSQINAVISKCRQGIGLLKLLLQYLPRYTLHEICKLYIRSHLDYGDVIYHTPGNICEYSHSIVLAHQMETLESVQYSAALAMTGAWRGTSWDTLCDDLGWESLTFRLWSRRLILLNKIVNNLTPDYIRYAIPNLRESTYELRRCAAKGKFLPE